MKKLYVVLAWLAGMATLGSAGSLETRSIGDTQGTILMYTTLVAFGVFAKLAGAFEPYAYKESRPRCARPEGGKRNSSV